MFNQTSKHHQKGAAVVVTAVLLLIGVTLVVMFAAQVGLQDQRISGNQYRHKQAFANAEAGLEFAASFLGDNKSLHDGLAADGWTSCTGNTGIFPCSITGADSVYGTISGGTISSSVPVATLPLEAYMVKVGDLTTVVGVGTSDDGTANSVVQVDYATQSLLVPGELPPLMMPGGELSGNFNIVPNPNGGGPGVPVSVWTKDSVSIGVGNWKTCDHDQYRDTTGGANDVCWDTKSAGTSRDWLPCQCEDERSNKDDVNEDIVMYPDADFPSSPFFFVFGKTQAEVKEQAETEGLVLANCTNLAADVAAVGKPTLVWIEGPCDVSSASLIGSRANPVILVSEGKIDISANSELWGIFVSLDSVKLNGGPVIHGSMISEIDGDLTNGTYYQVYDPDVFANLEDSEINSILSRMQYSWRDF
jgi:Tfp pilus assembly protein PilX